MSKIDELRRELAIHVSDSKDALDLLMDSLRGAQLQHETAVAALAAHDAAVDAMREDAGVPVANGHDAPSRQRRNLEAETLDRLTAEPQSLDVLVEKIGNVKPAQIEAALKRLVEAGKAAPHLAGAGLIGGYMRVTEASGDAS